MEEQKQEKSFSMEGRVFYKDAKTPAPDLIVEVWDKDKICVDDYLGSSITNENGKYYIPFTKIDFKEPFEGKPDLYVRVKNRSGELLFSSEKSVIYEAGAHTSFDVILPIPVPALIEQNSTINPTPTKLFSIPSVEISKKISTSDSPVEQLLLLFQFYLSKGNELALKREYAEANEHYKRVVRLIEVLSDVKELEKLSDQQIKDITEISAFLDEFVPTAVKESVHSNTELVNRSFEIVGALLNKVESSEADRKQREAIISESQELGSNLLSRFQPLLKLGIQSQMTAKENGCSRIEKFIETKKGDKTERIIIDKDFSNQLFFHR